MTTRLLVGTEKGLFALDSEDRRSWSLVDPDPAHKGWQVYALYAAPAGELYAGLSNAFFAPHLERSGDGGRTWTPIERSPRFPEGSERELKQVWSITAGPGDGRLLAGVAHAALFESADGGETWEWNQGLEGHPSRPDWAPGAGGLCLHTIIPDAADPKRVFIGISAVGVFRSDDGGHSWTTKNRGIGTIFDPISQEHAPDTVCCVHKVVQDPTDPNTLYQQNHTGVYRTHDAGDRWERIENGLPSGFGFPIVMLPGQPRTLFVVPQEE
ncbi:MAG: WD40/YVTN/BNR-like repeat-containing protein, partial [Candidatus Dormibacteraceae bacterium]